MNYSLLFGNAPYLDCIFATTTEAAEITEEVNLLILFFPRILRFP